MSSWANIRGSLVISVDPHKENGDLVTYNQMVLSDPEFGNEKIKNVDIYSLANAKRVLTPLLKEYIDGGENEIVGHSISQNRMSSSGANYFDYDSDKIVFKKLLRNAEGALHCDDYRLAWVTMHDKVDLTLNDNVRYSSTEDLFVEVSKMLSKMETMNNIYLEDGIFKIEGNGYNNYIINIRDESIIISMIPHDEKLSPSYLKISREYDWEAKEKYYESKPTKGWTKFWDNYLDKGDENNG